MMRITTHRRNPTFRKRLSRKKVSLYLTPIPILLLCICIYTILSRASHPRRANCTATESLATFDEYMQKQKLRKEWEYENRFQETIWDTIEYDAHNLPAVYPAWSDKMWHIGEFGRGLQSDLDVLFNHARGANRDGAVVPRYVHRRLDRIRGLQYAASVSVAGEEIQLTSRESIDQQDCTLGKRRLASENGIYIILPYTNRPKRLSLFLNNVRHLLREHGLQLTVIICILETSPEDVSETARLRDELFPDNPAIVQISRNKGDLHGKFSRGVALRDAARTVPMTATLFLCDVDMILSSGFVARCERNAIEGSQVFYPVFYSLYPYANAQPTISQRNGFWRTTSFGMVCIRNADFQTINPFHDAETRFQGWGSEDVYMFETIRNTSRLVAFRSVEPGLLHRWHSKQCQENSTAYWQCMHTNFATIGHPLRIGPTLLAAFDNVDQLYERVQNA